MPEQSFNTWAIVEVMGHKRFAGYVTEQTFGVATLIRVDVPETEQVDYHLYDASKNASRKTAAYSKLIGAGSIYMITPCTEDVARRAAKEIERWNDPIPVAIPRRLTAPVGASAGEDDAVIEDDDLPFG